MKLNALLDNLKKIYKTKDVNASELGENEILTIRELSSAEKIELFNNLTDKSEQSRMFDLVAMSLCDKEDIFAPKVDVAIVKLMPQSLLDKLIHEILIINGLDNKSQTELKN